MGRKVDVDELIDAQGISDLLGVQRTQPHQWRDRDIGFPEPISAPLTKAVLWHWPEVKAWAIKTGRLAEDGTPTRPPRSRRDDD